MEETNPVPKTPSQPPTKRFMDIQGGTNTQQQSTAPVNEESVALPVTEVEDGYSSSLESEQRVSDSDTSESNNAPEPFAQQPVQEVTSTEPEPATQIAVTENATPEEIAPDTEQASGNAPVPSEEQPADPVPEEHVAPHPSEHHVPVVAVVVASLVALALTGLVIFTYLKSRNQTDFDSDKSSSTNSATTVAKPQASPADVDAASSNLDSSLSSINEATDFSTNDISDQSLGL